MKDANSQYHAAIAKLDPKDRERLRHKSIGMIGVVVREALSMLNRADRLELLSELVAEERAR